jgi:transcriptional regulator with XRE-family HTH domain
MSPEELRAFRENIGLSRREFAPKLFISEPTLERWERGQGDIGKVQLRILRKMREHLGAGHALSYFEYDADAELPDEALHDERQAIIDILKSQMIVLLKAQESDDRGNWTLCFGIGWASARSVNATLFCEGSKNAMRPFIDFTVRVSRAPAGIAESNSTIDNICFNHGVSHTVLSSGKREVTIGLRQRIYNTNCNPETIKHVLGSLKSCWVQLERLLGPGPSRVEGRQRNEAAGIGASTK